MLNLRQFLITEIWRRGHAGRFWPRGGHGFDSCQGLRFLFVSHLCHVDQFTFHILEHFSKQLEVGPYVIIIH